ncbi:MAG: FkbM family methyltransferase [Verrucomicrobiota bacterium]
MKRLLERVYPGRSSEGKACDFKYIRRRLRRRYYELLGNPRYSRPALNGLDFLLEDYLDFNQGYFIEVGANDGLSQSNTYYLEKIRHWNGVLIEPVPEYYYRCRSERNSTVVQAALVANDHLDHSVKLSQDGLMSILTDSADYNGSTRLIEVKARTLTSILKEADAPQSIDFFSLDVEGYEMQVLNGLDLKQYQPRFLMAELKQNYDEVNSYLLDHFDFLKQLSHHDYLYIWRG